MWFKAYVSVLIFCVDDLCTGVDTPYKLCVNIPYYYFFLL